MMVHTGVVLRDADVGKHIKFLQDLIFNIRLIIVARHASRPEALEPRIMSITFLGLTENSGQVSPVALKRAKAFLERYAPLITNDGSVYSKVDIDCDAIISAEKLKRDDMFVIFDLYGEASHIKRAVSPLRQLAFLAPFYVSLDVGEYCNWDIYNPVDATSWDSAKDEMQSYFAKRNTSDLSPGNSSRPK
jgi:hypothetical protein